jgi:acyl-coenzyme A synthetase/AMP-(fatty) acid ligase
MSFVSFVPFHRLLVERDSTAWASYWVLSDIEEERLVNHYPHYIAALTEKIRKSGAKRVFIISKDRVYFLAGILAGIYAGVSVVVPPSDAPELLKDLCQSEDLILDFKVDAIPNAVESFVAIDPSCTSLIFYTSGSTGQPKPIEKTLSQLEAEIATLDNMWGSAHKGMFLSTVPHQHLYGLLFSLLWPVCGGYPLKRQTFTYWEEILACKNQVQYLISSPPHLGRFSGVLQKRSLKCDFIFSSGGELSFKAAQLAQEYFNALPIEVFGSTETGGIAYRQQQEKAQLWVTFPEMEIWADSEERLCLKSPYLPHNTVYQTQDRVAIKADQTFSLLGRADRIVKIEGKRVSLLALEQKLCAFEQICDAVVIALPNQKRNELGAILVLSAQGQEELSLLGKVQFIRTIKKNLRNYFENVTLPRRWRFVESIPTTVHGKRLYHQMITFFNSENERCH